MNNSINKLYIIFLINLLQVAFELDREIQETYELVVKASEDCLHSPLSNQDFSPDDDSLLKVIIFVNDINDHPPEFVKRVFTGGVSTEADFGTEFMQIKVTKNNNEIYNFVNLLMFFKFFLLLIYRRSMRTKE